MKLAPPLISLIEIKACPVCDQEVAQPPLYELQDFNVYRCQCGLQFISPCLSAHDMVSVYSSSEILQNASPVLKDYYEYDVLDHTTQTYRDYDKALSQLGSLTSQRKLLEVGCGRGGLLRVAKEKGWDVFGIDSSLENITELRKYDIAGVCVDYLSYHPAEKFDVIILWDLIEHPTNPAAYLQKSRELLHPGGLLLIATPHYPNLLSMIAGLLYQMSLGKIKFPVAQLYFLEHTTYFSMRVLRRFLERQNFKVLTSYKTATDLKRYNFSKLWRTLISMAFWVARILQLDNRVIVIAQR